MNSMFTTPRKLKAMFTVAVNLSLRPCLRPLSTMFTKFTVMFTAAVLSLRVSPSLKGGTRKHGFSMDDFMANLYGKITHTKSCSKCNGLGILQKAIISNGEVQIKYICQMCGRRSLPISKKIIAASGIDINMLEVGDSYATIECEVKGCVNVGYEWHHIAPRHLFENPDLWPQIKLCKKHHKEWHETVTPNMCKKNAALKLQPAQRGQEIRW